MEQSSVKKQSLFDCAYWVIFCLNGADCSMCAALVFIKAILWVVRVASTAQSNISVAAWEGEIVGKEENMLITHVFVVDRKQT